MPAQKTSVMAPQVLPYVKKGEQEEKDDDDGDDQYGDDDGGLFMGLV